MNSERMIGLKKMRNESNKVALVTGTSSGIGEAFARLLASQGYNLFIVARREEQLQQLSHELENKYSIKGESISLDLSKENDIVTLEKRITESNKISMLINNAGFGTRGVFVDVDINKSVNMIKVHIIASIRLIKAVLPQMIERNSGTIINVSTLTADFPNPGYVVYTATKAFLNSFSKTLQLELKEKNLNITVQSLCPGLTKTNFFSTEEWNLESADDFFDEYKAMSPERVVEESLTSLSKGTVVVIPGSKNRQIHSLMTKEGKSWREATKIVHLQDTS